MFGDTIKKRARLKSFTLNNMAFKIWEWKEKSELTGKLTAKLSNIPPYGKKIYGFELDNGEIWYSWGTSILVGQLAPLPFLARVHIKYLGKGFEKPEDKHEKILFDVKVLSLPARTRSAEARAKEAKLPSSNMKKAKKGK